LSQPNHSLNLKEDDLKKENEDDLKGNEDQKPLLAVT
jgi:hypothetical protein